MMSTNTAINNAMQCIVIIPKVTNTRVLDNTTTCICRDTHVQQLKSNEIHEVDVALIKNLAVD